MSDDRWRFSVLADVRGQMDILADVRWGYSVLADVRWGYDKGIFLPTSDGEYRTTVGDLCFSCRLT